MPTPPAPAGGVIRRYPDSAGTPHVLAETAFNPALDKALRGMDSTDLAQFLPRGLQAAASFGFTTVQEGAATPQILKALRDAAKEFPGGRLPIDVVAYVKAEEAVGPRWALDRGMICTSHHDAPAALPGSIANLSSQVTRARVTRTGRLLGGHQRVFALDAIRSITIDAAHQYFEEDSKGTIEVGKLADLVILSENPLTIPEDEIKNIEVRETIRAGVTVHETTHDPIPVHVGTVVTLARHC